MKKLARLPGLKYTFYGVFCLFFSAFLVAGAGLLYCVDKGFYVSAPPEDIEQKRLMERLNRAALLLQARRQRQH